MGKKTNKTVVTQAIHKILIVNRGEIALRIIRTCKVLGIACAVTYSDADRESLAVRYADEAVHIGASIPAQSYLNFDVLINAANSIKADAIHPGYGFLSENWEFAKRCEDEGLNYIGPSSQTMRIMGDKLKAREAMKKAGVPLIPGTVESVDSLEDLHTEAKKIGYPLMIKAVGGGGGKGIKIVHEESGLESAYESATGEARSSFANAAVYLEKYFDHARHIEIQVLGDKHGHGVHLGERECSMQRRHQKVLEESPSIAVDDALREKMGSISVQAVESLGYAGSGTFEFLLDDDGTFYFLEMNTRLQVEHTVTEMRTGIDLVAEQIRIAAGEPLGYDSQDVTFEGWSIEARINAEDPHKNFVPSIGVIDSVTIPGGNHVRFDSLLYPGVEVTPFYDSMIGKLIVWGKDRNDAIQRMRQALRELHISGVKTTIAAHLRILEDPNFLQGKFHTNYLETALDGYFETIPQDILQVAAIAAAAFTVQKKHSAPTRTSSEEGTAAASPWLISARRMQMRNSIR